MVVRIRVFSIVVKKKIFFLTVGRSDYHRQLPIINYLKLSPEIELKVVITGSHSSHLFGKTSNEIKKNKVPWFNCCPKKYFTKAEDISSNISSCQNLINKLFKKNCPDILVLFGDRYEVLAGASASFGKKILLVHIHGGSLTLGSFDDQIRHALTKLSHIHLTSIEEYAKRLRQMGEEKWRIKIVGAPGIDYIKNNCNNIKNKSIKKFLFTKNEKFILVCLHSETTNLKDLPKQLIEIEKVLKKIKYKIIITYPNADPGSDKIINFFKKLTFKNKDKIIFVKNLGNDYYFLLKKCEFILGNSSSGIVEAATFRKPVIDLGIRQKGKIMPKNVINCKFNSKLIINIINKIRKIKLPKNYKNPYGDGKSGIRIGNILKKIKIENYHFQKKFINQ